MDNIAFLQNGMFIWNYAFAQSGYEGDATRGVLLD
jgi:hypothetical protein